MNAAFTNHGSEGLGHEIDVEKSPVPAVTQNPCNALLNHPLNSILIYIITLFAAEIKYII